MLNDESYRGLGLPPAEATTLAESVRSLTAAGVEGEELWHALRTQYLRPEQPFVLHVALREFCFRDWDTSTRGPHPLWKPARASSEPTSPR